MPNKPLLDEALAKKMSIYTKKGHTVLRDLSFGYDRLEAYLKRLLRHDAFNLTLLLVVLVVGRDHHFSCQQQSRNTRCVG